MTAATARLPVLARFQGDAHVRVIELFADDTMDDVAARCAAPAVDRQVRHPDPAKKLWVRFTTDDDSAVPLPPGMTVADAGFNPMECIDVYVAP